MSSIRIFSIVADLSNIINGTEATIIKIANTIKAAMDIEEFTNILKNSCLVPRAKSLPVFVEALPHALLKT
jgi:hypothetical protein